MNKSEDEVFEEVLSILRPGLEGKCIDEDVLRRGFAAMCLLFPISEARVGYLKMVELLLCKPRFYDPATVVQIGRDIFYDLTQSGLLYGEEGVAMRVSGKLCRRVLELALDYCELMFKGGLEVLNDVGPLEVRCEGCNFRAYIATLPGGILYLDTCEQCGNLHVTY